MILPVGRGHGRARLAMLRTAGSSDRQRLNKRGTDCYPIATRWAARSPVLATWLSRKTRMRWQASGGLAPPVRPQVTHDDLGLGGELSKFLFLLVSAPGL